MRANHFFFPAVLIALGVLFLLDNLKLLQINIWSIFIPLVLILAGVATLLRGVRHAVSGGTTSLSIPLEGAESARVRVKYGAGKVYLAGGAASGEVLSGSFEGGVDHRARRSGPAMEVELDSAFDGDGGFWFWDGGRREWDVRLNTGVPLALDCEVGAVETHIDLTDVRCTDFKLQTGASSTDLRMPARAGLTTAKIAGGAASVKITIPPEVAARIQWSGGIASIDVNTARFPQSGNVYQSPNYDTATNKIELKVEMGMGSVEIR